MMFMHFHIRDSFNASTRKGNASARSAIPFKSRLQESKLQVKKDKKQRGIKITLYFKSFWKRQKQDPQATKAAHYADTLSLTPDLAETQKRLNHRRSSSVCDSKFSSVSSALSFSSLPHELISVTASQCTILLHLLHKVARSLEHQERFTANFSTNFAHLFARKERAIVGNKRLSKECRKALVEMMAELRELVGRTFLKKTALMQRSLQLTKELEWILSSPRRGGKISGLEVDSEITVVCTTPPLDAGQKISVTIGGLNSSVGSLPDTSHQLQIDIHNFQHTLHTLREDLDVQMQLDQALRAGIVGPCEDLRIPATIKERTAMRRFVAFVEGCLVHLEGKYAQERRVAKGLEVLGDFLRDGSCRKDTL